MPLNIYRKGCVIFAMSSAIIPFRDASAEDIITTSAKIKQGVRLFSLGREEQNKKGALGVALSVEREGIKMCD